VRSAWVHPLGRAKGVHGTARPGVEEGLREGAADEAAESRSGRFPFKTRRTPFECPFKQKYPGFEIDKFERQTFG